MNKAEIDELNDNWIRVRRWDLPTELGPFLNQISFPDPPSSEIAEDFLNSLAARPMPKKLRSEVEEFIKNSK